MKWLARKKKTDETVLPMLSTERLVLRAFDMNDAVHVYAFAQSDQVGPMAGFAPHTSLEDSRTMVQKFIESGEVWALVAKNTGRVIGFVSLQKDGRRSIDSAKRMGYVLGEAYWGQGYATEACREVLRYAFGELGCEVVSADHFPFNQKSKRVIKKLGFTLEGTIRRARLLPDGSVSDLVTYSLLRSEYEAQQKNSK